MTAKIMAIVGAGLAGIAGSAAAVIIHANAMNAQANATSTLNEDLIQAQANLMGWQQEAGNGNLASADYKSAFSSDLANMHGYLSVDMSAL